MEALLATGEHRRELESYFGAAEYRELVSLGRAARNTSIAAKAPRVIIVPGIMGSQLGLKRAAPLPPDVLWLDPMDIAAGRLIAPFDTVLPQDAGYYVVTPEATADDPKIVLFRDWLIASAAPQGNDGPDPLSVARHPFQSLAK